MSETLKALAVKFHANAKAKGFHSTEERKVGQYLMLVVTELVEAQDELHSGRRMREVYYGPHGKPEGFGIELGDAAIRILETAERMGLTLTCSTWGLEPSTDARQAPDTRKQLFAVTRHLAKAMEAWRVGDGMTMHLSNALDALSVGAIRWGIDLPAMCEIKHAYNVTRSYRHGGKAA